MGGGRWGGGLDIFKTCFRDIDDPKASPCGPTFWVGFKAHDPKVVRLLYTKIDM